MEPDLPGYRMLFGMLDEMERYEDMLEVFKVAEQQHPGRGTYPLATRLHL